MCGDPHLAGALVTGAATGLGLQQRPMDPAAAAPSAPPSEPPAEAPPSGPSPPVDEPRALGYLKLKKWMVDHGAPKAEVEACLGKEELLQLSHRLGLDQEHALRLSEAQ